MNPMLYSIVYEGHNDLRGVQPTDSQPSSILTKQRSSCDEVLIGVEVWL